MRFSRRQLFLLFSLSLSLACLFVPQIFQLGVLTVLVTNLALRDLLLRERIIFSIYPAFLALGIFFTQLTLSIPLAPWSIQFWLVGGFLALLFYLTLLSLNILNVATIRTVPLRKVALTAIYYLGILISFLWVWGLFNLYYDNFGLLALFIFLMSASLGGAFFYFDQAAAATGPFLSEELRPKPKIYWLESLILAIVTMEASVSLIFLPAPIFIKAIFASGTLFILISFFQSLIAKKISKKQIYELALAELVLLVVLVGG